MGNLKRRIQGVMTQFCFRRYRRELNHQKEAYLITKAVSGRKSAGILHANTELVHYEECNEFYSLPSVGRPYVVFTSSEGVLESGALNLIEETFDANPGVDIIYADEDCMLIDEDHYRLAEKMEEVESMPEDCFLPWFKPEYSPDTLLSYFYMGSMVAVRRERFADLCWKADSCSQLNLYDFILKAVEKMQGILHLKKILYHSYIKGEHLEKAEEVTRHKIRCRGYSERYNGIKMDALGRRGLNADILKQGDWFAPCPVLKKECLVSIIIPSKDNPALLKQCMSSIRQNAGTVSYEIIVVDNGSIDDVKEQLMELSRQEGFIYLYQKMEFNFSRMCNIGASAAHGDCLLFLNDDIKVMTKNWLSMLGGQAMQKTAGAVGVKLLYPDSTMIQHIGISLVFGEPRHTLLKSDDSAVYRHGRNRGVMDVTAVTGACLMIRKELFQQQGFDETLSVAYNDVDLCLRLLKMGYSNIVRNDIICYHYESVTRGSDSNPEKRARLECERTVLFQKHSELLKQDRYDCEVDGDRLEAGAKLLQEVASTVPTKAKKVNPSVYLSLPDGVAARIDYAGIVLGNGDMKIHPPKGLKESDDSDSGQTQSADNSLVRIDGWCVVPYTDNCRYKVKLLLHNDSNAYLFELKRYFRQDIADAFQTEKNVKLSGFVTFFRKEELPAGEYQISLYLKDCCSRQRLCQQISGMVLNV